jgi:outer membrane protein TolC
MTRKTIHALQVLAAAVIVAVFPSRSDLAAAAADDPALAFVLAATAENNPSLSAAAERTKQAKADVRAAIARMGPRLTGSAYGINARETLDYARESYSASLNLAQTLYAGNTLKANKLAADMALAAVKAEGERTFQDAMNSARTAYYELLRSAAKLGVAEESLRMSREHLVQAESLYRGGMVPRGDVLRVKVSVSQAEQDKISASSELESAWAALERAVGTELSRDAVLPGIQVEEIDKLQPPTFAMSDGLLETALVHRPETRAYASYRERSRELIRAAAGERAPRITFSASTAFEGNNVYHEDDDWQARLDLQWTIYDSGETAANIAKAKAAARELIHQTDELEAQIRQEALTARIRLKAAEARFGVAKSQASDAREDYRLALRRYDAQVGTNLDVLDSRSALINSLTAYVNAVYDIAAAQAGVIYASGADAAPEPK